MARLTLEELRKSLDSIDSSLIELLARRVELAREIGGVKHEASFEACFAPIREAEIFRRLGSYDYAGLNKSSLERIYVEIVSACRAAQEQGRICVLGEKNGWFNDAALARFGHSADINSLDNFEDFCIELEKSHANLGFASFTPEHSPDRLALIETLMSGKLGIVEEFNFSPEFSVVTNNARDLSEVSEICVTGEMLKLMRQFFITLSFDLKVKICRSMFEACESLKNVNPVAAILPSRLVESFKDLIIIKSGIKSELVSRVKFLTLSVVPSFEFKPGLKTTLMCPTRQTGEHIYDIVATMRHRNLQITDIHNLNFADKAWDTIIIIEMYLPESRENFEQLLKEFDSKGLLVRCCGFYPVFK